MSGPHDERERIAKKLHRRQFAFFRHIRNHADIEMMVQHLARHIARKHAVDAYLHAGMQFAEAIEDGKQGVDRAFVDADFELAAFQPV